MNMRHRVDHLYIATVSLLLVPELCQSLVSTCSSAEESKTYTLTCQTTTLTNKLEWTVDSLDTPTVTCTPDGACVDAYPDLHTATLNRLPEGGGYRSTLTILNVTRSNTNSHQWRCVADGTMKLLCDLQVFAIPETPVCDKPLVLYSNSNDPSTASLKVTCTSPKVYPSAQCTFFQWKDQRYTNQVRGYEIEHHLSAPVGSPPYRRLQCHVTIPVADLSEGTYQFRVHMDIDGGVTDSEDSEIFRMIHPKPELSSDCSYKDGYVALGSQTSCTCRRFDAGYPPGSVFWYDDQGNQVGTASAEGNGGETSLLRVSVSGAGGTNPTYVCRVTNGQDTSTDLTYTPKTAWGPTAVELTISPERLILCPGTHTELSATCAVSAGDVSPSSKFRIRITGTGHKDISSDFLPTTTSEDGNYVHTLQRNISSAAKEVTVSCGASNKFYPLMSTQETKSVAVVASPIVEPLLIVGEMEVRSQDQDIVLTNPGSIFYINVTCEVNGGQPEVKSYEIECGNVTKQEEVTGPVAMEVLMSSELGGLWCSCSVQHVSGCYNRTTRARVVLAEVSTDYKTSTADTVTSSYNSTTQQIHREIHSSADPHYVWIGVGCVAALVLLGLPLVLALYLRCRHQRKEERQRTERSMGEMEKERTYDRPTTSEDDVDRDYNIGMSLDEIMGSDYAEIPEHAALPAMEDAMLKPPTTLPMPTPPPVPQKKRDSPASQTKEFMNEGFAPDDDPEAWPPPPSPSEVSSPPASPQPSPLPTTTPTPPSTLPKPAPPPMPHKNRGLPRGKSGQDEKPKYNGLDLGYIDVSLHDYRTITLGGAANDVYVVK